MTSQNAVNIRHILKTDASKIQKLVTALGASPSIETVEQQIDRLSANSYHFGYVAEKNSQVVGFIHFYQTIRLTSQPFTEIVSLVVDAKHQNQNIGKQLVAMVNWHQNKKIRVRCNEKRLKAHQFYKGLDFNEIKVQKVFEKHHQ